MSYLRLVTCAAIMMLISAVVSAQQDYISIFAGSGRPINIPATSAGIVNPGTTATDSAGNFYIVVPFNGYYNYGYQDSVLKVSSSGNLTIVAGNGFPGYSGDGGPATQAELYLSAQSQVAVDSNFNVYIADTSNCVIRVVNQSTGIINTFAGTPNQCGFGGDGGPATAPGTYLYYPYGVAADSTGNVYIADTDNYRIRQVNSGGTISTVAGNGTPCYGYSNAPCGDGAAATSANVGQIYSLAVDGAGNVFISDYYNYYNPAVRSFSVGGNINTVAGAYNSTWCYQSSTNPCGDGGPATSAGFYETFGIAVDARGNLFIADFGNYDVREVFCADGAITTCTPPGAFLTGDIYTVAGTGGSYGDTVSGSATSASLGYAYGIAVDSSDDIFIPNYDHFVVNEVTYSTGNISTVAGNGTSTTNYFGNDVPATNAVLNQPWGVAFDSSGNAYIADSANCVVREVNTSGIITLFAGTPGSCGYGGDGSSATGAGALLNFPTGVAADSLGNVYIADTDNHAIRMVSGGNISTFAGVQGSYGYNGDGIAANSAYLYAPFAVAVDSNDNVYIADTNNQRIREVTSGTINTIAGTGGYCYNYYYGNCGDGGPATSAVFYYPEGVAVDKAGNVYVSDTDDVRVRRINTAGIIDTFAGNGYYGFEGDGGKATQASLYYPGEIAVDPAGDLIIADTSNQRIRLVDGQGLMHTVAGNGTYGGYYYYGCTTTEPATAECLANPYGVGVDSSGNIYIGDTNLNLVQEVNAVAVLNASRTNLVFDVQPINTSGTQSITLTANGPLTITSVTPSGPPFTESDDCGSGPPEGGICTMNIVFRPKTTGTFTGTVTIADNGYFNNSLVINLTGPAVPAPATATALTSSLNPSNAGQSVTLTATVTSGSGTPNGSVTFYSNGTAVGTKMLNTSGVAVLTTTTLKAGNDSIKAIYNGNTNFATSTSNTISQVVNLNPTTTTLTSSSSTSYYGQSVTFTATVTYSTTTSAKLTGSVGFYSGTKLVGSASLVSGTATLNTTKLPLGVDSVTATYKGSPNFATSTSSAITQTVNANSTSTALTTSPNPSTSGASVALTATVTSTTSSATPTGTVKFYSNGKSVGSASLVSGTATLNTTTLKTGTDSITATYAGATGFTTSTSSAVLQTVN